MLPEQITKEESKEDEELKAVQIVDGFPDWRKVETDDGIPYYYNAVTQETQWECPVK